MRMMSFEICGKASWRVVESGMAGDHGGHAADLRTAAAHGLGTTGDTAGAPRRERGLPRNIPAQEV